jgi:hypothetical protein
MGFDAAALRGGLEAWRQAAARADVAGATASRP